MTWATPHTEVDRTPTSTVGDEIAFTQGTDQTARRLWRNVEETPALRGTDLLRRIAADLPTLSPQLRKVAEYLLRAQGLSRRDRITDFARLTATAPVTIVRLAKRYGFQGFYELKMAFLAEAGDPRDTNAASVPPQFKAPGDALQGFVGLLPILNHPSFVRSSRWLHEAQVVWVGGQQPVDEPWARCLLRGLQLTGLPARPASEAPPGAPLVGPLHLHLALESAGFKNGGVTFAPPHAGPLTLSLTLTRLGTSGDEERLTLGVDAATTGLVAQALPQLLAAWAGAIAALRRTA